MTNATADAAPLRLDAGEVLSAIRCVVQALKTRPLAADVDLLSRLVAHPPAPRHIAALMRVVGDEGMSVSALADALGVSLATASQVVTDLEADHLVERYTDPDDRRRTLLRIAEERRPVVAALVAHRLRPVQRALDRLRPAEQRALLKGLHLITQELGSDTDEHL